MGTEHTKHNKKENQEPEHRPVATHPAPPNPRSINQHCHRHRRSPAFFFVPTPPFRRQPVTVDRAVMPSKPLPGTCDRKRSLIPVFGVKIMGGHRHQGPIHAHSLHLSAEGPAWGPAAVLVA